MNNISHYRKLAGLTQQEAADAAQWRQGRWSSYETGARTPNTEATTQIIRVLNRAGVSATFEKLFLEQIPASELAESGEAA